MAAFDPHFAQIEVRVKCDLCDLFDDVQSYCRGCKYNICKQCTKPHSKICKNQKLVPVFDGIVEKKYPIVCDNHTEQFRFYCESCKFNICDECHKTDHKTHAVKSVSEHGSNLKHNFHKQIDLEQTQSELQEHFQTLEQHEQNFREVIQTQIEKVQKEKNEKRKLLDIEEGEIIQILKEEQTLASQKFRTLHKELEDMDKILRNLNDSLKNELKYIPNIAVLQFVRKTELKLKSLNKAVDLPNSPTFVPSTPGVQGNKLLGSLKINKDTSLIIKTNVVDPPPSSALLTMINTPLDPLPSLRRDLNIISKFTPARGDFITDLCSTADDLFWVGTSGSLLFLVDKTGDIKSRVKMPGKPWYLAVTCRNDVIVSTQGHVIYHVTRQGDISAFVDVSPDVVNSITTTRQGDVFACVDSGSVLKVKKFNAEGDFVLEVDTNLFTTRRPRYVHSVSGDTVCIQDGYPRFDNVCNLTLVDGAGKLVSRVTRTKQLREDIVRMLWDGHGHVVTATLSGEYIHVFSGDGTCRQSYHVKGSEGIRGLCLGSDDVMLIGTKTGEVIVAKYLQ